MPITLTTFEKQRGGNRYCCSKCDRIFNSVKLVHLHEKVKHGASKGITCKYCDKHFHSAREYEVHIGGCKPPGLKCKWNDNSKVCSRYRYQ